MSEYKKAVSLIEPNKAPCSDGSRRQSLDDLGASLMSGIAGDPLVEGVPKFIQTQTEKVYSGGNNTFIVLGRDRPHNRLSGYGGAGYTQAGAIDIVAGRFGADAKSVFSESCEQAWVNSSFERDAARIYISQRTDVDRNFKLAGGRIHHADNRSAIALKADGIRIIGREGIKLITKTDAVNSQGAPITKVTGVDLIAGNDDSNLAPLVRGDRLTEALTKIIAHIDKLNGIVDSLLMTQMQFNNELTHHFHISPFAGIATSPSPPVVARGKKTLIDHLENDKKSLKTHKKGLQNYKKTYLCMDGAKYINSYYNNTN